MPKVEVFIGSTKLSLLVGDITAQDTQAIVNAITRELWGGGRVDGAIHRAGGRLLPPSVPDQRRNRRMSHGRRFLPAENLKADYVIHAVGPIWSGGEQEDTLLRNAYWNSLRLAHEKGIGSISFHPSAPALTVFPWNGPPELRSLR